MRYLFFISLLLFSCNDSGKKEPPVQDSILVVDAKPKIDPVRQKVSGKPVAEYSETLSGDGVQGAFSVRVYETEKTFHYLMKIKYAEVDLKDTLKLPDFGILPKPAIKPASQKTACVVGFYDDKNEFKEYKLIQVSNGRVKIKALKHYAVATYQDHL